MMCISYYSTSPFLLTIMKLTAISWYFRFVLPMTINNVEIKMKKKNSKQQIDDDDEQTTVLEV